MKIFHYIVYYVSSYFLSVQLGLGSQSDSNEGSADSVTTPTSPSTLITALQVSTDEPIHIINVAIKHNSYCTDEEHIQQCYEFVQVQLHVKVNGVYCLFQFHCVRVCVYVCVCVCVCVESKFHISH